MCTCGARSGTKFNGPRADAIESPWMAAENLETELWMYELFSLFAHLVWLILLFFHVECTWNKGRSLHRA